MRTATSLGRLLPALFFLLSGCAAIPDAVRDLPEGASVELDDAPFYPQERFQCGPAALTTVLVASGADVALDAIVDEVYLPGREGSLQVELVAAGRRHGRLPYLIDGTLASVHAEIEAAIRLNSDAALVGVLRDTAAEIRRMSEAASPSSDRTAD